MQLEPCPWCQGRAETRNSRWNKKDHWSVICAGCGNPWFDCRAGTEAEAITAWNTRTPPPVPASQSDEALVEIARLVRDRLEDGGGCVDGPDWDWDVDECAKVADDVARAILPIITAREAAAHAAGVLEGQQNPDVTVAGALGYEAGFAAGRAEMREEAAKVLHKIEPDEDAAGGPATWPDFVQVAEDAIRALEPKP